MALRPIDEVFQNYFDLPGKDGKVYRVPECDAITGMWCQRMVTAAVAIQNGEKPEPGKTVRLVFEGDEEDELQARLLTRPLLEEMRADGFGHSQISFCTQTILFWHGLGREVAELYWNAGGRPEDFLPAANRAARRKESKKAKATSSTGTAGATTTP